MGWTTDVKIYLNFPSQAWRVDEKYLTMNDQLLKRWVLIFARFCFGREGEGYFSSFDIWLHGWLVAGGETTIIILEWYQLCVWHIVHWSRVTRTLTWHSSWLQHLDIYLDIYIQNHSCPNHSSFSWFLLIIMMITTPSQNHSLYFTELASKAKVRATDCL